jgi:chromate transporter
MSVSAPAELELAPPRESLGRLFLRFLKFGSLAWGGPVAQIAMLRQELVVEEKWVTPAHFNRVLALYQVLPGPEAHELCVYFGMLSRGRIGGILAGLGFMLPGFVLMFLLSWLYFRHGMQTGGTLAVVFAFVQAAVAALIVRAIHRIGGHILTDRWLWAIAALAASAQLANVHFGITLTAAGLCYVLAHHGKTALAFIVAAACTAGIAYFASLNGIQWTMGAAVAAPAGSELAQRSLWELFLSGLKAGMLTFGGAYTAIPFLQDDAVKGGTWMTNNQFLDGLALSSLLPAPLIIFATFVGYAGGGALGAVVLTAGVFLPAFSFSLLTHEPLERLVSQPTFREFLEGVTAGVVGLIVGTAIVLLVATIKGLAHFAIFAVTLACLFRFKSKAVIPLVVAGAALAGWVVVLAKGST